jgi:aspartyl-tRNA(Asn)/glutamyl-tRNA(Gln) amidotransferase subunit A
MKLNELTIHELQEMLRDGITTSVEVTGAVFDRVAAVEERVHSYITLLKDYAMKQAEEADRMIRDGKAGPLTGIPLAIKDILCTEGIRTTCGSHILHNFIPPYDATISRRLKEAGAVFVGKANMDEFAMGSSTETSYFGITRNPWDLERIPGGSSGGSAAAVAADECIASLGSDTGGSIRQPAALCGIVGLKPTYGRVSRFGLIAFASSLDQIGPFSKDVEDTAIMLNAIAGYDPNDSTSVPVEVPDYTKFLGKSIEGWTIGVPREYFVEGIDPEVSAAVEKAIAEMEALGAKALPISLPHTEYCLAVYYIVAPAEASSNLARYDGVKYGYRAKDARDLFDMYKRTRSEGFGAEVKRRIMIGTYALSSGYYDAYYKKASQVRALIKKDFAEAFQKCDVIVTPTTPTAAFRIGEKTDDPLQMYLSDIFTISTNLAGIPGISVPCGYTKSGLPIGLQFQAGHFEEGKLIQAASAYERNAKFEKRRPNL